MLFNSSEFALFFPAVAAVYFALPHRFRWPLLLAASYYFYMCWRPGYVVLILLTTTVDYAMARLMGRTDHMPGRRKYLLCSLVVNLGLLGFFKYYGFFTDTIRSTLAVAGIELSMPSSPFLLPVGISFYTFQSLSYLLEVYWGRQQPETHFGRFALYVAFFPQLVAGPIERPQHLLPQFLIRQRFDYDRVTNGLKLMAWGMFKKVVIADRLAQFVDQVYAAPAQCEGIALTAATVLFAFQIFCDFSGYTDIAIGVAAVLGVDLMNNFRRPYFATSVADFWRRWHISLSTWFRDYLYIPLGGGRVAPGRWCVNILVVFLVSGLWHGAAWKFAAWGALHGLYMIGGRFLRPYRQRLIAAAGIDHAPALHRALQTTVTFCLVCFAWIFFRAANMRDAVYIAAHLFDGWRGVGTNGWFDALAGAGGMSRADLLLSAALIGVLLAGQLFAARRDIIQRLAQRPLWVRWAFYSALMWAIFILGIFRHKEFIYFTF